MKENAKIFLGVIISVIVSVSGSIVATTMLSSDKVSYSNKTSASGSTTVSGALDDLYDAVDINERLGNTNISGIGDGTITGAISSLTSNSNVRYNAAKDKLQVYSNGTWVDTSLYHGVNKVILYDNGNQCTDLTGGYASYPYTNNGESASGSTISLSLKSDSMVFNGTPYNRVGLISTKRAINLTGKTKLRIYYTCTSKDAYSRIDALFFTPLANNYTVAKMHHLNLGTDLVSEYDISDLQGSYYFGFRTFNNVSSSHDNTAIIKKVEIQ